MTQSRPNLLRTLGPGSLLVSFCLFWFSDTIADPDLWGHVRFGQDILHTGSIVQTDDYSYRTGGQPWMNHEWLAEVIFAAIYDRFGPAGLIVFKLVLSLMIFGLCDNQLRACGLGSSSSVLLLMLMSVPFRMGLGTIRPQFFTYVFFLLELLLIDRATKGREYGLWALPILFAVWVNLHGGVLAGVGVLGVWIALRITVRRLAKPGSAIRSSTGTVPLGLLAIACIVALMLNPYGDELIRFLLRTATVPRPEISEWTPLGLWSPPGQIYLGLVAIGILGLAGSTRAARPESILILGLTAVLPLISNRHYTLFALALVVLGAEHIADAWNRGQPRFVSSSRLGSVSAAIRLVVALILTGLSLPRFGCIRIEPFYFPFPARAVALLKQSGFRGNMAVPFDWGEYVLWYLGPDVKVSIDGRRETVYSEASYRQSLDFEQGRGAWDALLKTGPATELVLAPNQSPIANLLSRSKGWLPLYQDTFCVIFAREGLPALDRIVRTPVPALPDNGDRLCFPPPGERRVVHNLRANPAARGP